MAVIAESAVLEIQRLTLGSYDTNCYIIKSKKSAESVVVDAPDEALKIVEALAGTRPRYILLTHNHRDHIEGLRYVAGSVNVPVAISPADARGLTVEPELLLNDNDVISFGGVALKVLHTPGHTPGSVCFLTGEFLISGDTLFPGGPGHTTSPECLREIIESIRSRLFTLGGGTGVFPGHGPDTVLGKEKDEYAVFARKPHEPDLCGDVLWLKS